MIRSRDAAEAFNRSGLEVTPCRCSRGGGLFVWVLPALAAVAVATLWLVIPADPAANLQDVAAMRGISASSTATRPDQTALPADLSFPGAPASSKRSSKEVDRAQDGMPSDAAQSRTLAEMQLGLIGEWTGFYQGQRRLTVGEGGLATMVVEPEGLAAVLLAPKLTFEVRWTINGEQLEFETLGGEPLDGVEVVGKMYGKRRSHRILELEPNRIVLLDEDGVTEYVWHRVQVEPNAQSSAGVE